MARHGINAKSWFYGFARDLRTRGDGVRHVLGGCAAEQWLNAELFGYLGSILPPGMYAYPEYKKRDVSVFGYRDTASWREDLTLAVIETKLVYASYADAKVAAYTARLCRQMKQVAQSVRREQGTPCQVVGLIVGVWVKWPERYPQKRKRPDFRTFRRTAGRVVREIASLQHVRVAKKTMETFVPAGRIRNGHEEIEVGLVGQYILL